MNIVAWLNSLDELLYELMTWLVFFPVTLWRIMTRPLATMRYAEEQLMLEREQQYRGTVAPPIMLILTVVLTHAIALAIVGVSPIVADQHGLAGLVNDNLTLLLLKVVLFSVFAVVMASWKVTRSRMPFDRESLRGPFYAQCFATSPFALLAGLASLGAENNVVAVRLTGIGALLAAPVFYGIVQVRWFRAELNQSLLRSFVDASLAMIASLTIFLALILLFR